MKVLKFKIPIYGGKVRLVFTNKIVKTGKKLGYKFSQSDEECRGMAYQLNPNDYLILIKKYRRNDMGVLSHEALHIVNYIFKSKGITINTKNDEAQCYLLGYIMQQIQYLKDKK